MMLALFFLTALAWGQEVPACLQGQGPLQSGQLRCGSQIKVTVTKGTIEQPQEAFLVGLETTLAPADTVYAVSFCRWDKVSATYMCVYVDWYKTGEVKVDLPNGMTMEQALILAAESLKNK
jgi:hypothetical protein